MENAKKGHSSRGEEGVLYKAATSAIWRRLRARGGGHGEGVANLPQVAPPPGAGRRGFYIDLRLLRNRAASGCGEA